MSSPLRMVHDVRNRRWRRVAAALLILLLLAIAVRAAFIGLHDLWTVVNLFAQLRATTEDVAH